MIVKNRWWQFCIAAMLAVALGCNGGIEGGGDNGGEGTDGGGGGGGENGGSAAVSELEGAIEIDGSSTVYPISEAVANAFQKDFPNVNVTVAISGTGGGFKRFTKGETDISDASRPIKDKEFQQCKENSIRFIEVPVAYDGLSVVINPANDWVDQLSVEDLQRIFLEADDQPTMWSDVRDGWPEEPLTIYAPGTDSGTFDYFKEVVVGKDESKSMRSDMSVSEDDNVLVTGVAGQKGGIGFFGCAYYFENSDKLKAVPIVNDAGDAVSPSPETIESGEYNPLSRPLFIYVSAKALSRPEMKKFVEFYLDNAPDMAARVGYVALPSDIYDAARERIKNRSTGTHFLTAEGEKRSGSVVEVYKAENLLSIE